MAPVTAWLRQVTLGLGVALLATSAWPQASAARAADAGAASVAASAVPASPSQGREGPASAAGPDAGAKPAEVRVGDTVVFTLRAARGSTGAAARARAANEALRDALAARADNVHVEPVGSASVVYVGERPIVQLTEDDAALAGDSGLAVHADRVAAAIRAALAAERKRSAVAGTIFNVSLAVLFAVLALYLLRRAWQLGDRAGDWLEAHPERVPALRLRAMELLNRANVRTLLALGLEAGRWIVLFGLGYAWLIATFSLFEATRGLTERLSGALLSPLTTLASRIAAAVPLLVLTVLALLVLALVLRAVRLFFREVARGTTRLAWLPRDLAAATGALAEVGLVIVALLLVAPVITGGAEGVGPRLGLLLLGTLALGAVPLAANAVFGAVTLFGRRLAVDEWIEVGTRAGRVVRVGLLETTLREASGAELRVPHLARLLQPTLVHGRAPRVSATLVVERALATPALAGRIERALGGPGSGAAVRLADVRATHVTLEIAVTGSAPDALSVALWAALAEVDAMRHEARDG